VEILCHRGWWERPEEKNSPEALHRAFAAGLGVETDLRDFAGAVVVSHDPPTHKGLDLDGLLALHATAPHTTLALNVKADGLAVPAAKALADHGVSGAAFVFDMAVPDQLQWLRTDVATFTRHSDVEPEPVLYLASDGVWLDDFGPLRWWTAGHVQRHLDAGKRVAVVSPELHGRDHRDPWAELLAAGLHRHDRLALCTDLPAEALEVFR
jgi:hypothetical protein